jgi:hypothetical protein
MEQTVEYRIALDYNCEVYGDTTIELVRYVPEDDNLYEDERILLYSDSSSEYIKEFKKNFYKNCSNHDYIEELLKKDLMKFENLVDDINNIVKKFNTLKEDIDIDVFRCEVPVNIVNEVSGKISVVVDVSIDNNKSPRVDKIVGIGSTIDINCNNNHKDYILAPKVMIDNFLHELNMIPNIEFMEADVRELESIVTQDIFDIVGDMTSNVSSFRLTINVRYSNK